MKFDADSNNELSCDFEGHKPIQIKWEKDGLNKLPDRMVPQKNTLRFTHVKMEDAGDYYCTGSNSFSNKRVKIHVSVYGMIIVIDLKHGGLLDPLLLKFEIHFLNLQ